MKWQTWLNVVHWYTSTRVLIWFACLYQQCFSTSYFGIYQVHFTLFALKNTNKMIPVEGDILHNRVMQAVSAVLAPHIRWRFCIWFLSLLFLNMFNIFILYTYNEQIKRLVLSVHEIRFLCFYLSVCLFHLFT